MAQNAGYGNPTNVSPFWHWLVLQKSLPWSKLDFPNSLILEQSPSAAERLSQWLHPISNSTTTTTASANTDTTPTKTKTTYIFYTYTYMVDW